MQSCIIKKNIEKYELLLFFKKIMSKLIILSFGILVLNACGNVNSKAIEFRETQISKRGNILELGDNANHINVTEAEVIKPIKHRKFDIFFDK